MELKLSDFCGMRGKDVVGLWYGYKKIVSIGLDEASAKKLEKVFLAHGLCYEVLGERHDYRKKHLTHIVAKDPAHLKAARAAYAANRYDIIGALLGYPKCCVSKYFGMIRENGAMNGFVRRAAAGSKKFCWQLNNLLDFDGRLCGRKAAGLDISGLPHASLISHNPCSYDCAPSLKIAEMNRVLLKKEMTRPGPETDPALLARPVFYADDYNFAILDGKSGPGGAVCRGAACALGLDGFRDALNAGGRVSVSGRTATVSLRGRIILEEVFPAKPLLLPFDR